MTKKEFEKETYLAPKWGLRIVTVERHFLDNSPGKPGEDDEIIDDDNSY